MIGPMTGSVTGSMIGTYIEPMIGTLQMDLEVIEGIVVAVVFSNPDNGYSVVRLDTDDGAATAAGCIPGVSAGEKLELTGMWTTHKQYGAQFKVESFELKPPSGAEEVYRYLASGIIKSIGPAKARDIVKKFGGEALAVIENNPEKLSVIKGISQRNAMKIGEDFRRQAELRRLIDFFSRYNIKPLIATRVYRDFGDEALISVRENPYIISAEYYGAEFFEADAIALDLGFESDCPERVSAALVFELSHNLSNGHTFIPKDKLIFATSTLIGTETEVIAESLEALCECGDVVIEAVAGEVACYLRYIFEAERYIADRLTEMARDAGAEGDADGSAAVIGDIERKHGIEYAALQASALELASAGKVMALTGGPGTGKTTTVRGILMLFDALGLKTVLCAPTGRAAKRLSETCSREAATIHRLLGAALSERGELVFDHDECNPLDADAVIVDESSMIDILLMRSLLAAMKRGCRLVMVGDADQLPPVGPGNMFADVIRSGVIPTISLTEIFRQAEGSGIVRYAHSVNNGLMPDLTEKCPDLFFLRRRSDEELAETVAELYGRRLPDKMGVDPSQIQVLTPTRKHAAGTVQLNDRLRQTVNPPHAMKMEKTSGDFTFRTGDKVMQIRNNYDIIWKSPDGLITGTGVYNGDIGAVKEIDHARETVTVDFDDKLVVYSFEQLPELEPAFAMTVHKSQGSEYHAVILAMTAAAPRLLTRSVLYTAMTRAKELLVIVGSPEVMESMVRNDRRQRRYSGLRARLTAEVGC